MGTSDGRRVARAGPRQPAMGAAAERGRAIFQRADVNCASCQARNGGMAATGQLTDT